MKGWHRDNYRHSLAARGIRLSYKAIRGKNFIMSDLPSIQSRFGLERPELYDQYGDFAGYGKKGDKSLYIYGIGMYHENPKQRGNLELEDLDLLPLQAMVSNRFIKDRAKTEIMEELYPETKKRALVSINEDQLRIEADIRDAKEALNDMQQKKEDLENLKDLEPEKEEWEEYDPDPITFRERIDLDNQADLEIERSTMHPHRRGLAGKRVALYTPAFVASDLAPIGIDAVGTAGAAAVGFIPLAVAAGVIYGGATYAKKKYDKTSSR